MVTDVPHYYIHLVYDYICGSDWFESRSPLEAFTEIMTVKWDSALYILNQGIVWRVDRSDYGNTWWYTYDDGSLDTSDYLDPAYSWQLLQQYFLSGLPYPDSNALDGYHITDPSELAEFSHEITQESTDTFSWGKNLSITFDTTLYVYGDFRKKIMACGMMAPQALFLLSLLAVSSSGASQTAAGSKKRRLNHE